MGIFEAFTKKKKVSSGVAIVAKNTTSTTLSQSDEDERRELYKKYRNAYERVALIKSIIDVHADSVVQPFYFDGPKKEELTQWADKVNLMEFFHRITKSMLLYGNGFVEIVKKNGNNITQLKIINPEWMDVYRDKVGLVTGYGQVIKNQKMVLWGTTGSDDTDKAFAKILRKTDSIIHFKHNVLGSEKYGLSIIKSLLHPLNIKLDMEENLRKIIFKYVAPLIWAKVGSNEMPANGATVQTIADTLRDLQAESEITTSHLVELSVLDFNAKGMDIKTPLVHTEQQIITGGQVPPILLGRGETADRATAEVQLRNFGSHIKSIQRELKIEFEDKIIVGQELGSEKDKLIWEHGEEREWERTVDILRGLVTDGMITAQKANDLLPPRYREKLPEIVDPLNGQGEEEGGMQKPRPSQKVKHKVTQNPNDPTQSKSSKPVRKSKTDKPQ